MIEYWSAATHSFPAEAVAFTSSLDTDLYACAKVKACARSIELSRDGSQFALFSSDRCVADDLNCVSISPRPMILQVQVNMIPQQRPAQRGGDSYRRWSRRNQQLLGVCLASMAYGDIMLITYGHNFQASCTSCVLCRHVNSSS